MATLDELQKQKPLIDRVLDFLSKNLRLLCILLGISCVLLGGFMWRGLKLQKGIGVEWMFCLVLLFFIINLYLVWSVKHGKDIPEFISTSRGIMTFGLIVISVALFVVGVDKNCRDIRHIVLLITIVLLCLVNYGLSRTYRSRWDMPDVLLKKLVKIESLGVIIAGLQLIIAYPQLQLAYDSASKDDITKFNEDLKQFRSHVEEFIIVDIPDSLVNEDVKTARVFQKQIYAYSLFITNANWDREIPDKSLNIDSVLQTLKLDNKERDNLHCIIAMHRIESVNKRLTANLFGVDNAVETLSKVEKFYSNHADSTLFLSQIDDESLKTAAKALNELKELSHKCKHSMIRALSEINKINKDSSRECVKARRLKKEIQKIHNAFKNYYEDPAFTTFINVVDTVCLDYMAFLNIVQLKYAYNVDFDLENP